MKISLKLTRAQLKVFSAICSNMVVVWLVAIFGTKDVLVLTLDFFFAIVSLDLAVKAENLIEKYD